MANGKGSGNSAAPQLPGTGLTAQAAPSALKLHEEMETGFEDAGGNDFQVPFISLLQKLSPFVDKDDGKYVEGAEPGMFYDAAKGELMKDMRVIPCLYKRQIIEWRPERKGFVAAHEPGFEEGKLKNEKGVPLTAEGNLLVDTRYFFCLRLNADGDATPCILSMTSTQVKKAKNWMSRMEGIKETGPQGKFTAPMFSRVWKISSVVEENDQGKWYGYKTEVEGPITAPELFAAAKSSRAMFKNTEVKPPAEEQVGVIEEKSSAKM